MTPAEPNNFKFRKKGTRLSNKSDIRLFKERHNATIEITDLIKNLTIFPRNLISHKLNIWKLIIQLSADQNIFKKEVLFPILIYLDKNYIKDKSK